MDPMLSPSKSNSSIDSQPESSYANYTNDELLKEFLDLYCEELFTQTKRKNIILPSKTYLKTLDEQAEYLDYFHLRSVAFSENVLPKLKQEEKNLRLLFHQIDAVEEFIRSYRDQLNHINDVLHDIDAHTKKYSKFVPNFLRAKAKLTPTIFALNLDTKYMTVQNMMEDLQKQLGDLIDASTIPVTTASTAPKELALPPVSENARSADLALTTEGEAVVVSIGESGDEEEEEPADREDLSHGGSDTNAIMPDEDNESPDDVVEDRITDSSSPRQHMDSSTVSSQGIDSDGDEVGSSLQTARPGVSIVPTIIGGEESDEDEGEVIFAAGESDEED